MRIYERIYYSCESQEYAVKGVVVGSPFYLPTILACIQNYRIPSATKGENILLVFFSSGFSILKSTAEA